MYPNAHDGIKKIYLGEVLSLIAVVVGSIAGIAAIIGYKVSESPLKSKTDACIIFMTV